MKRQLSIILICALLCGCSCNQVSNSNIPTNIITPATEPTNKPTDTLVETIDLTPTNSPTTIPTTVPTVTEIPTEEPLENITDEDSFIDDPVWDKLKSVGKIQTESGLFYVYITVPQDLMGNTTQEELDMNVSSDTYTSAELNSDGSVTIKMTKKQHKKVLDEVIQSVNRSLQEMVDNPEYSFTRITHNENLTLFEAYLSTTEVGMTEGFMVMSFFMLGGLYNIYSGEDVDSIIVHFYNRDGELVRTADSSEIY